MNPLIIVLGAAAVAALVLSRDAFGITQEYLPPSDGSTDSGGEPASDSWFSFGEYMDPNANLTAFLRMIRMAEGTESAPDPYRVVFGYQHVIQDLRDHPTNTKEWGPIRTQYGTYSSAAGAYQFIVGTWNEAKAKLGLADFSPASQDAAAVYLIQRRGALADVEQGRFQAALDKLGKEWASLPTSTANQPTHSVNTVMDWYVQGGGGVA